MNNVTFSKLNFNEHLSGFGGVQAIEFYENGYGVSVVQFPGSYGYEQNLYELAVLRGTEDKWDLCYDTPITNDVEGYLTEQQVEELMFAVSILN